jgi:hypothetical protein
VQPFPLEQLGKSGTAIDPLRTSAVGKKHEEITKPRKIYCCGGAEEYQGGDDDAAETVAHALKEGDGEEEKGGGAAAALPHAVAPVRSPSVYSYGGAEERK